MISSNKIGCKNVRRTQSEKPGYLGNLSQKAESYIKQLKCDFYSIHRKYRMTKELKELIENKFNKDSIQFSFETNNKRDFDIFITKSDPEIIIIICEYLEKNPELIVGVYFRPTIF